MKLKMLGEIVSNTNYLDFINNKPFYYKKIDFDRFPNAYNLIKNELKIKPVIHIVGTNGKGSTGRFLAMILKASGKKVGHFTSPHLFKFNERFWIDGSIVSDLQLQEAHESLLAYFKNLNKADLPNTLSYFEWATLLAAQLFKSCDEIILEAGLGGEKDSTNVFPKKLSVFTRIAYDHIDILGNTLESIARTKFNAMENIAIMPKNIAQKEIAYEISKNKNCQIIESENQISQGLEEYAKKFNLPSFLIDNLNLAANAFKILYKDIDVDNIFSKLGKIDLPGRLEKISSNVWIDVGHNEDAAIMIANHFKGKKINLIYNAYDDKDISAVLRTLKPIIKELFIYKYSGDYRKIANDEILEFANKLNIKASFFKEIKASEDYLVFGSFVLINRFLGENIEK